MPTFQQVMMAIGGVFSPLSLPTLDWWLKADSLALSDGDPVSTWTDSSGAGKNYSQTTTNRPTYKTNILNGKPVVRFNGSSNYLDSGTPRGYGTDNTLIIVCSISTTQGYILSGSNDNGGPGFISGFTSALEFFTSSTPAGERSGMFTGTSGYHILALTRTDGSGNYVGYCDGRQVFSKSVINDAQNNWNGRQAQMIGRADLGSPGYTGVDIAEIIHCSSVLGSTDLNNTFNYLGTKYGITINPSFTPAYLPTMDWWMRADVIAQADNSAVVDWADSSWAARHYGQNTVANQPTYKTNIVNGQPVVRFSTDDRLVPDPTARGYGSANTMIMVCTPTSSTNGYLFGGAGTGFTPSFISGFSSKAFEYFFDNGNERATFATTASGFHTLMLTRTDDSGNYIGYYDSAQVFSTAVTAVDWSGQGCTAIGANTGGDFDNGDIAEIIHCTSILDSTERSNIASYILSKYGI